jgi:hypothetical protein
MRIALRPLQIALIAAAVLVLAVVVIAVPEHAFAAGVALASVPGAVVATGAPRAQKNAGISDEAQHVINSLEAHFLAVQQAVSAGGDSATLNKLVASEWGDVQAALKAWGQLEFAADYTAPGQMGQPSTAAKTA